MAGSKSSSQTLRHSDPLLITFRRGQVSSPLPTAQVRATVTASSPREPAGPLRGLAVRESKQPHSLSFLPAPQGGSLPEKQQVLLPSCTNLPYYGSLGVCFKDFFWDRVIPTSFIFVACHHFSSQPVLKQSPSVAGTRRNSEARRGGLPHPALPLSLGSQLPLSERVSRS